MPMDNKQKYKQRKKGNWGKNNYHRKQPPKGTKKNELNSVANEFQSFKSSQLYSNYYFGFDIFEFYSQEQLAALVRDPMAHNDLLREISLILYGTNGVYTNTVDYMTAMPTLDRVIVVHGDSKRKKSQNRSLMESTLRTIKDKEYIRDALFCGMIEGISFGYFETTARPDSNKKTLTDYEVRNITEINELGYNASIITLPVNYTKIVGIKNSSYVIAFNLDYFNQADGEDCERKLRKYPKEIRDAYTKRYNSKTKKYNDNGNWVILDNSKTIVHKIRSKREEQYGRPLVLAAIKDILYGDYFTDTKRNVLDEINHLTVIQTFPEGREKGTSALTKQQQQAQHDTVKSAVMNKNNISGTTFVSVAAGTKVNTLDTAKTDLFDDKYESNLNDKIALDLGIAASLLNGSSQGNFAAQTGNLELITGLLFQWVEQITNELNKCISQNIIKDKKNWVEVRYLPITHVNKNQMVGFAKDLYLQGRGSLSLWSAACGIAPEVFFSLLDQELEEGIDTKYPVHATSYTLSKEDSQSGRPQTDNPTENTIKSRGNDGNNLPSPSDAQ